MKIHIFPLLIPVDRGFLNINQKLKCFGGILIAILISVKIFSRLQILYLVKAGRVMKKMAVIWVASFLFCGSAFGASLNLKATWTANGESDMKEYRLYRTDGTRALVGTISHQYT